MVKLDIEENFEFANPQQGVRDMFTPLNRCCHGLCFLISAGAFVCSFAFLDGSTAITYAQNSALASNLDSNLTVEDWPAWRGLGNSGSIDGDYPTELNFENAVWKAPLPGKGCSTPIVFGGDIYLTAPDDGKDALVCIDKDGQQKWVTHFGDQNAGKHRNGSGSNASPVTDGKHVFVYFKSGTLAAVDFTGAIQWQKNLVDEYGDTNLYWDHGTSPVLTNDTVVMARMQNGDSWVAAFEKHTGNLAWKVPRNFQTPQEGDHGYSTPVKILFKQREALLVYGAEHLTIHDADDGSTMWSCGNFNPEKQKLWPTIATPVIVDNIAIVAAGRNDRGQPLLYGVKLEGSGDVTADAHVWARNDIGTFVPSPVTWKGKVFLVRDRGEVECLNPATGESVWRSRFPKSRSNFYSSPLIAGGNIYAPREDGGIFVADIAGGEMKLTSEGDLRESIIGSPIPFMGNRILVRGAKHLFCFGDDE